jgi:hypothetical protein
MLRNARAESTTKGDSHIFRFKIIWLFNIRLERTPRRATEQRVLIKPPDHSKKEKPGRQETIHIDINGLLEYVG